MTRRWAAVWVGVAVAGVIALVVAFAVSRDGSGEAIAVAGAGLPRAHHFHSLLVSPSDPDELLLGTHEGLYVSSDGGRHWQSDALAGSDAMTLARPNGKTLWVAGHMVFKRSLDGGNEWSDLHPAGLPSLDIHAFAVDPRDPARVYAAVASKGLYRSTDSGASFRRLSARVGGNVNGLAVMPDGRILAADYDRGLLTSSDEGATWSRQQNSLQLFGLAVNPRNPKLVLGAGSGVALSVDGGRSWRAVLHLADGAGPVAWSASDPARAYAIGLNRTLYRSDDGGRDWQPVEPAG